jgi:acetyl-CoA carboxylase carboxyl transferase subunit alpha
VTLVDTPGAYPGIEAEERGQAEAIARSIACCLDVRVPFVSVVIGEGGSGGAIALAAADRVLMLEHSIYSVISPEGCASILWRSAEKSKDAAEALKMTAQDGVIRTVLGGAHRDKGAMVAEVDAVDEALRELVGVEGGTLRQRRRERFLAMGRQGIN